MIETRMNYFPSLAQALMVHYHDADQLTSPARRDATRSPRAPARRHRTELLLMWANRGNTPVTLRTRLRDASKRAKP